MLYEGVVLGLLTFVSYVMSFKHFPVKVKQFLITNFFITDIISVVFTYILLTNISKSLIAVVAAIVCGLLVNLALYSYRTFFAPP